jgi:hypothetical protein
VNLDPLRHFGCHTGIRIHRPATLRYARTESSYTTVDVVSGSVSASRYRIGLRNAPRAAASRRQAARVASPSRARRFGGEVRRQPAGRPPVARLRRVGTTPRWRRLGMLVQRYRMSPPWSPATGRVRRAVPMHLLLPEDQPGCTVPSTATSRGAGRYPSPAKDRTGGFEKMMTDTRLETKR